ncbi:DUF2459 domain-containing protein [Thioalkalivibrio sp. ALJ1]|uniref:DUF2459 domain-containing protein n=1 Tax=Thioalkalivibrio sp. ALJ1 TaxID=1158144 RepID=UPI00056EA009|nr:DUF2459 domain-containing protein [Thioalkalivibrio sp. ALJ1]
MRPPAHQRVPAPRGARALRLALVTLTLSLIQGCAAVTVQAPPEPDDPVTVALLDHGRHSSLVLPTENADIWRRYSYGDWAFYVERRTGPLVGLAGLFLPTRGGLGRQTLTGPELAGAVEHQLRVPLEELYPLIVTRERVTRLREELEAIWETGNDDRAQSTEWDMAFVEHPESYTLFNNSNRMVARWLQALEIDVSRPPILSNWHVEPP